MLDPAAISAVVRQGRRERCAGCVVGGCTCSRRHRLPHQTSCKLGELPLFARRRSANVRFLTGGSGRIPEYIHFFHDRRRTIFFKGPREVRDIAGRGKPAIVTILSSTPP